MSEHNEMPQAWADLIEAITLLAQHPTNNISPLWCEHDTLHVCADRSKFTAEEVARLEKLGFHEDTEWMAGFHSYRYGSA
jgi:hypothetical protein